MFILSVEEHELGYSVCIRSKGTCHFGPWVKRRFPYYNGDGTWADKVDKGQTSSCGFVFDKTHPAQLVSTHIEL